MKRTCLLLFALMLVCIAFTYGSFACFGQEVIRPEDSDKCHLTVFGDVPVTIAQLRAWRPDCHVRQFTASDPLASNYAPHVGAFPAIVYQAPDGVVLAKLSGSNLPRSEAGWQDLVTQRFRPFKCKPSPQPEPQPEPPAIAPAVIPDVAPVADVQPEEPQAPIWIYLVIGGVAAGVSLAVQIAREVQGEK